MFIRSLFSRSPASIYNNYYKKLEKATRENVLEVKVDGTDKTKLVKVSLKKDGTLTNRSWKKIRKKMYIDKPPKILSKDEAFLLTPGNLNKKLLETRINQINKIYDKMETESKKTTKKETQPITAIRKETAAMMRIQMLLFDFKTEAKKKEIDTNNLSGRLNSFSGKLANKVNVKKFFSIYVKGDLKKEIEKLKTDITTFQDEYRKFLKEGLEEKDKKDLFPKYHDLSFRANYILQCLIDKDTNLQKLFDEKVIGKTARNEIAESYKDEAFDIIGPLISEHTKSLLQARNDTAVLVEKMDSKEWQKLPLTEKQKLFDDQIDKNRAVINQHLIEVQKVVDDFAHTRDFDLPYLGNVFAQSIKLIKKFKTATPVSDPTSDIKEHMRSFFDQLAKLYEVERDTGLDENITMEDINKFIAKQDATFEDLRKEFRANERRLEECLGELDRKEEKITTQKENLLILNEHLKTPLSNFRNIIDGKKTSTQLEEDIKNKSKLENQLADLELAYDEIMKRTGNALIINIPVLTKLLGVKKGFKENRQQVITELTEKFVELRDNISDLEKKITTEENKLKADFEHYKDHLDEIRSKQSRLKEISAESKKTGISLFGKPKKLSELEEEKKQLKVELEELNKISKNLDQTLTSLFSKIHKEMIEEAKIKMNITTLEEEKKEIETEITGLSAVNGTIEKNIKAREDNQQAITESKNLFWDVLLQKIEKLKSSVEEIKSAQVSVNWTIEAFQTLIDSIPKTKKEDVVDSLENALARVTKIDVLQKSSDELLADLRINITVVEE